MRRCLAVIAVFTGATGSGEAQQDRIHLSRFVLGVDVPEPPALVVIGVAPPLRLGSAPKPLAASGQIGVEAGTTVRAAALDVAPYYWLGGGERNLRSYRSNSIGARLMRVLTKTIVSVGAAQASDDPGGMIVALGARATLHDPHDPILNSPLPEDVAAALAKGNADPAQPPDESVTDRGVDLAPVFARARRAMRARAGDAQISAGWGVYARAAGGVLAADSLGSPRHAAWLTAQYTTGRRFDVLASIELREAFASRSRLLGGLSLRRKGSTGDAQLCLRFDARNRVLHPAVSLDLRLGTRLGAVASVQTESGWDQRVGLRPVVFGLLLRWFPAEDAVR